MGEPITQMRFKLAILAPIRSKQTHAKDELAAACDTLMLLGEVPNIRLGLDSGPGSTAST
jgi:hypothetical protein